MDKEISSGISCSFCGKDQRQTGRLIAGPTVYICEGCIELCGDILKREGDPISPLFSDDLTLQVSLAFERAVEHAIASHFESGRAVHGISHGWLVEVKPIKKIES